MYHFRFRALMFGFLYRWLRCTRTSCNAVQNDDDSGYQLGWLMPDLFHFGYSHRCEIDRGLALVRGMIADPQLVRVPHHSRIPALAGRW